MDFKEIFKSKNELPQKCYLCGKSHGKLEEDHLPPKCIFPKEFWARLIFVPICKQCHDKRDKDDEYFRDYLSLWCGKNVPNVVHQKRESSWEKRPSHEIGTWKNRKRVWIELRSGLTVPMYALKGEEERINPVLISIAKGYNFSLREYIIPESYTHICLTKMAPFSNQSMEPEVRFWYSMVRYHEVIPGMFKFKHNSFRNKNINKSNWFLEFYDSVQFFVQFRWERKENSQKQ